MQQIEMQHAADMLKKAKRISVLTGAGVSKESGVPTFRDALEGLWQQYDPQQLATPEAFRDDPELVWEWYTYRRKLVRESQPNAGHVALAQLESHFPNTHIITQNVDDLHERAGSQKVIHLHGYIAGNRCSVDCQGKPTRLTDEQLDTNKPGKTPRCPHCGSFARPDVVWFGEMLPDDAIDQALQLTQQSDVMLVVGTSGLVTPAATLPGRTKQAGGAVIEVNPDTSGITQIADIKLDGPSGDILPQLMQVLLG